MAQQCHIGNNVIKKIFIVIVVFLLASCSSKNDDISQKFNDEFSKRLSSIDVTSFYFRYNFKMGQLGVCDSQYHFLGHCKTVVDIWVSDESKDALSGMWGEKTDDGWLINIPTTADQVTMRLAYSILSEGILKMARKLEQEKITKDTWSK